MLRDAWLTGFLPVCSAVDGGTRLDPTAKEQAMFDWVEHRKMPRQPASKPVKIILGSSVLDCTIVDENATGLKVRRDVRVALPDHVIVELPNGQRWGATTRWQKGAESGLKYEKFLGLNEAGRRSASLLFDLVHRLDVQGVLRELDENDCFGQDELRTAAASVCQSVRTLERLLARLADRAHSRMS